jgi:hypothetical protein
MNVRSISSLSGSSEIGGGLEGPDWVRLDEVLHREFNAVARAMSMMVESRTIYEMMDPFWPNARGDASLPDFMREFGEIWTSTPKVLVSRTGTSAGQHKSFDNGVTMHRYAVRGAS